MDHGGITVGVNHIPIIVCENSDGWLAGCVGSV